MIWMARSPSSIFRITLLPFIILLLGVWPSQRAVGEGLDSARQAARDGQTGFAALWLRKVVEREPFRKGLWEQIARDELSAGDSDSAENDLLKARELKDITPDGLTRLASLMENKGEWRQAAGVWQDLVIISASGEVYSHLVAAYRRDGQFQKALRAAQDWQTGFPRDGYANYILSLFLAVSKPEESQRLLENCVPVPRCRNGLISLRAASAQAAISEDPGYRLVVMGRWLGSQGEWDLAEPIFHTAVDLSPEYAEAWAFLGQALTQNGKSGLSELEKALQLNPDSVITRALLALYWGRIGESDKAIEQMQAVARLEPARAVWQVELGNLTAQSGDLITAQVFFSKSEALEPENPLVWEAQSSFSLKYNVELRDLGLPAARRLVELRPDDPASLDKLGSILMALGDLRGAERILQQSITIDPDFATAYYHLGQVYWQLSELDLAVDQLRGAVRLDVGGPAGTLAGRLLDRILLADKN